MPPTPSDPRAWNRARLGVGLAGFSSFLGVYATQPLLPTLERTFGVSEATAALTVSGSTIAIAIASPFAGLVAARADHRRIIALAALLLSVPMLLAATATSIPVLVAWRAAHGLVVPFTYAVAVAYISEEWPAEGVGRAMSSLLTGNIIGGAAGRIISGTAASLGGWRAAFVALGLTTLAGAVAASRALTAPDGTRRRATTPPEHGGGLLGSLGLLLRHPRLAATCAVGFNVLFTQVATFTYVTFHLAGPPHHLGPRALGWLFLVYLVGAAATPVAGRLVDRVGSRRVLWVALATVVAGCALTLAPSVGLVAAGLTAVCTGVFVSQVASTTFLRAVAPAGTRGAASGLYVSSYYVGGAAGAVAPAFAWERGGWPATVAVVAGVQLLTLAIAWQAWRSPPAAPPGPTVLEPG
ncbi:MAG: MFS transporter [Anaeromyxobacter sp.]